MLDYGCGPGVFTIPAARIVGDTGKVYALDVRARALQYIREQASKVGLKNIETVLMKEQSIATGLSEANLDIVLIFDVIQDIKDKQGLLKEMDRILKPGGWLSLFSMHIGNEPVLKQVKESGLFILRDSFSPPGSQSPSTVLNFVKKR